jgi:TIR domain
MVTSPIFISYASIDQDVAEAICDALHKRGLRCWISSRDIGPGENFQESIVAAIKSARVMVLVFGGNANNSDEIKKEIALAGHHHVAVIPVRVEDVVPSDALAYEFATRQWVDLFKDWERQIGRLAAQIKSINAAPPFQPAGGEAKSTAPVQLTTKRRRWPIAALSLLTTVAVAGVALILYHQALPIPWAASRHLAPPPLSSSAVASSDSASDGSVAG